MLISYEMALRLKTLGVEQNSQNYYGMDTFLNYTEIITKKDIEENNITIMKEIMGAAFSCEELLQKMAGISFLIGYSEGEIILAHMDSNNMMRGSNLAELLAEMYITKLFMEGNNTNIHSMPEHNDFIPNNGAIEQ